MKATFAAPTASTVPARFDYRGITQVGPGILVTGAWKAVSRAGVAQATWTQPTDPASLNRISGTFNGNAVGASPDGIGLSGTRTEDHGLLTWTWGWSLTATP